MRFGESSCLCCTACARGTAQVSACGYWLCCSATAALMPQPTLVRCKALTRGVVDSSASTDNSLYGPKWADSVFAVKPVFRAQKKKRCLEEFFHASRGAGGRQRAVASRPAPPEFLCFGLPNRPRRAGPKPPAESPGLPRRSAGGLFRARTRRRRAPRLHARRPVCCVESRSR